MSMSAMWACSTFVGSSSSSPSRSVESMSTPWSSSSPLTTWTSEISGTPRSRHGSSARTTATIALETRFLAPRTSMSPTSGAPPSTTRAAVMATSQTQTPRGGDGWSRHRRAASPGVSGWTSSPAPSWRRPWWWRPSWPSPSWWPSPFAGAFFAAAFVAARLLGRRFLVAAAFAGAFFAAAFVGGGLLGRRLRRRALGGGLLRRGLRRCRLGRRLPGRCGLRGGLGGRPSSPRPSRVPPWSRPSSRRAVVARPPSSPPPWRARSPRRRCGRRP